MQEFLVVFLARLLDPMIAIIALVVTFLVWCGMSGAAMKSEAHFAPLFGATLAAVVGEIQLFLMLPSYQFIPQLSLACAAAGLAWSTIGAVAAAWFMKNVN